MSKKESHGPLSPRVGPLCKKLAAWLIEAQNSEEAKEYLDRAGKILKKKKAAKKAAAKEARATIDSTSEQANPPGGQSEIMKRTDISTSSNSSMRKAGGKKGSPKSVKVVKKITLRKP
jgi:hypothetical protein